MPAAGTDAAVWVELHGAGSTSSGRLLLASADPDCFARARAATFELSCPALGELKELVIGHDGRGPGSGWHLQQVRAVRVSGGGIKSGLTQPQLPVHPRSRCQHCL